jgi:molybdopterin-guanine dinucleotide biosynthesis protein B
MRIVAAVGYSDAGKTLLLTGLIAEFKRRGLRTFAVKHCPHGFSLDAKGKDTWRYSQAGADGVALVSSLESAVLRKTGGESLRALAARVFPEADVVLVEGGKAEPGLKKIEVLRPREAKGPETPAGDLLAVVSEAAPRTAGPAPFFTPDRTSEICDLILAQKEVSMAEITLEVDGRAIPLNAFVREFIEKTVLGMISSLSGVDAEPKSVSLTIRRDRPAAGGKT